MMTRRNGIDASRRHLVIAGIITVAAISTAGVPAPVVAQGVPPVPDNECVYIQPDPKNQDYLVPCESANRTVPYNGPTFGGLVRKIFPKRTPEEIANRRNNRLLDRQLKKELKSHDRYEEGFAALKKGSRRSAIRKFKAALNIWPGNYDALLELGRLYRADKRYDDEIKLWQAAIRDCPSCRGGPVGLEDARRAKAWAEKSEIAEVKADLADGFFENGQYREAVYELEEVLKLFPTWTWAWDLLARSYHNVIVTKGWEFSLADVNRMVRAGRRAYNLDREDDERRVFLAQMIDLAANRLASRAGMAGYTRPGPGETRPDYVRMTIDSYEERARLLADEPKSWVALGYAAQTFHLADEAERSYLKAIEIGRKDNNPSQPGLAEYSTLMTSRINNLASSGKINESRRVFERAVSVNPGYVHFWTRMATYYAASGNRENALKILSRGKKFESRDGYITSSYARVSYLISRDDLFAGNIDLALARSEKVTLESPTHFSTHKRLGQLYMDAGRDADAIASFRDGFSRNKSLSGSMDIAFDMGMPYSSLLTDQAQAFELSGNVDGADSLYREAIEYHKDNYFAWYARSKLLAQMGREVEARETRRTLNTMIDVKILEKAASAAKHGKAASSLNNEQARDQASKVFDKPGRYVPAVRTMDSYVDVWPESGDVRYPIAEDLGVRDSIKNDVEFARVQQRRKVLGEIRVAVEEKLDRLYADRDRGTRGRGTIDMNISAAQQDIYNIRTTDNGLARKQRKILEFHAEVENIPLSESEELMDFGVDFSEQPMPALENPAPDQSSLQPSDADSIFTVVPTNQRDEQ